jgi:hypothetical protein
MLPSCTGVDGNVMDASEGAADVMENQAGAGRDAALADRLKMAGMMADACLTLCEPCMHACIRMQYVVTL